MSKPTLALRRYAALREEGFSDAYAEAFLQGYFEVRTESVLKLLRLRFGTIDEATETTVRRINCEARMNDAFDFAYDCESLVSFRQFLSH